MARPQPTPPPPWTTERFLAWEREQPEKYEFVVVTCSEMDPKTDVVPEPVIIVEVLSTSTEGTDRGPQWLAYQTIPSLRQYLLIAQEEPQLEVYQWQDSDWSYRVLRSADAVVDFAVADARMTMAEVYEATSLDPNRAQRPAR